MRKTFRRLRIHTIRTKLILSFLVFGLVPLLIFALFSYNIYLGALRQRISNYSREVVNRMQRDIDDYLLDIESVMNIKDDYYINQFINLNQSGDFTSNRKYTFRVWEDFNNLQQLKPGLEDIAITFPDGQRISSYGVYYTTEKNSYYKENRLLVKPPHMNFMGKSVITIARPFYSSEAEDKLLISADINLNLIAGITNVRLGGKGYVFIINNQGRIIYHPDQGKIGQKSRFTKVILDREKQGEDAGEPLYYNSDGSKYILTSARSKVTGWRIVSVAYANEVGAELNQLRNITFLIIGIILILVILFTIYLSYSLSRPVRELEKLTQRAADEDLSVKINVKGNDEIAQLGRSFNKMIRRIKKLLQKNIAEQRMIRKMEMESLENQIKPHFIYNTLDLIIGQLESNNSEKATHLIEALGSFFRLSLSHGKELVMINNEVEHVKNYLFIQQMRLGERYEFIVDIEDLKIMDKYIPKLLLQPLVENAIYHGILKLKKKGLIIIKGYQKAGDIYFEVIDNGVGIEAERLEKINAILQDKEIFTNKEEFFGLYNVNRRIKLKFGSDYGLRLESQPGIKTRSIIKIGIIEAGEGNV